MANENAERAEITQPVLSDNPELRAEMEALGPGAGETAAPVPAEEFALDPKFKSVGDLQKAYHELEKRMGNQPPDAVEPHATPEPTSPTEPGGLEITRPEKSDALPIDKYTQEIQQDGKLSDGSLQELRGRGLTDDMIQTHVAGIQALQQQQESVLFREAGGRDQWQAVQAWAGQHLDDADLNASNEAINSSDRGRHINAMRGLVARYRATPAGATQVEGSAGGVTVQPFQSHAEFLDAMRDPRYTTSQPYRSEVEARLAASPNVNR